MRALKPALRPTAPRNCCATTLAALVLRYTAQDNIRKGAKMSARLHQTMRESGIAEVGLLQGSIYTDGRDELVVAKENQYEESEQYQLMLKVVGMKE